MKVFFDANVWASAYGFLGFCSKVLHAVLSDHELISSELVLLDLGRSLRERFQMPSKPVQEIIVSLRKNHIQAKPKTLPPIPIRDPEDLPILAAALESGALYLVTGDKDLLVLEGTVPIHIVSPREFWDLLQNQEEDLP